jgi:hypothetical protein
MKTRTASYKAVQAALRILNDEELLALADNPKAVKKFLKDLAKKVEDGTFVTPLNDDEAVRLLMEHKGHTEAEARAKVKAWREAATKMDYRGPVCWLVRGGFTLKVDAPKAGPTYDNLKYLQDWPLQNDEPTVDSLVFWIPKLAEGSTGKSYQQMVSHRGFLRDTYNLPANHCQSFGSIALLFALILGYYKLKGDRVTGNFLYAASDTLLVHGDRLIAGYFDRHGLLCNGWLISANSNIGFFLLGMERLDA